MTYGYIAPIAVHFDDLDPLGMVHNSRFSVFVERAVAEWWRQHGHSFGANGPTSPDSAHAVASFQINFHAPVRGMARLGVHFWIDKLGASSAIYGFRILSEDGQVVHAEGQRVNVKIDPATGRPAPWTDDALATGSLLVRAKEPAQ